MSENEKAFPVAGELLTHHGMDLRDYFAAKAMQAIVSKADIHLDDETKDRELILGDWLDSEVAASAYYIADQMMEARKE